MNPLLQIPIAAVLLVPLIATIGQYVDTGFMSKSNPVLILFWPGVDSQVTLTAPVWLAMGAMLLSYTAGVIYLLYRRNLGKVALLGLIATLVAVGLASAVNSITGWYELQDSNCMDLVGKTDAAIFSLWHNPIWEEIVFRGIPFIILLVVLKRTKNQRTSFWAKAAYMVIPSIAFSLYHIPNHGASRIVDTFILGLAFAWMTLRFSFFAPLVLHCMFDAMMVANLGSLAGVPPEEITWLTTHHGLLNSISSAAIISVLALIPILSIWYWWKHRTPANKQDKAESIAAAPDR